MKKERELVVEYPEKFLKLKTLEYECKKLGLEADLLRLRGEGVTDVIDVDGLKDGNGNGDGNDGDGNEDGNGYEDEDEDEGEYAYEDAEVWYVYISHFVVGQSR